MTIALNTRQIAILNRIRREGRVLVEQLSGAFGTTPQTIRRDLQVLAETGEVMRFHGGAALLPGVEYISFGARRSMSVDEKDAIGREVARRIPINTMIMINGGTTTAAVARALVAHSGMKIISDSLVIANDLRSLPGVEVLVPGGVVRSSDGTIMGETALEFIRRFRADIAVIGAAAVDADGAMLDFDLKEVEVARAMIGHAKHIILAVDRTKFLRSAPVLIDDLSRVHTLVTDICPEPSIRRLCETHDVELVEASVQRPPAAPDLSP